jgi:hypothetical protein
MSSALNLEVPSGYERFIRFGANWTMALSPYMILYFILIALLSGGVESGNLAAELVSAGRSPLAYQVLAILDGLFHVLFFVTTMTLFALLRLAYPVRASLLLVCGAWQMIVGFTKALFSSFTYPSLGSAYLVADAAFRPTLIAIGEAADGLHSALQWMDSFGSMFVWILVALLPQAAGLPRSARWLGWIMVLGILIPGPGFLLVVLFSPFWLFILGRWMKRLALTENVSRQPLGLQPGI